VKIRIKGNKEMEKDEIREQSRFYYLNYESYIASRKQRKTIKIINET
jgi:hypothetical protein